MNSTHSGIHTYQRVDPPPERAGIAAGHRPGDLEARPDLGDAAVGVVDVDLRELDLLGPRRRTS